MPIELASAMGAKRRGGRRRYVGLGSGCYQTQFCGIGGAKELHEALSAAYSGEAISSKALANGTTQS